jgi:hypothetical protein
MRYTETSGLVGSFIEGDRLARTPNTANMSFLLYYTIGKLKDFLLELLETIETALVGIIVTQMMLTIRVH